MTTGLQRAGGLVLSVLTALTTGWAVSTPAAAAPPPATGPATVTLITGDRVSLIGTKVTVVRAPGRETVPFQRWTSNGDTYVVPADASTALATGRLDKRLFNVTQLLRHGYDDAARREIPLIVTRPGGGTARTAAAALPGTAVMRDLPGAGVSAVRADKRTTAKLWAAVRGTRGARTAAAIPDKIMLDGPVRGLIAQSVPQIGAPRAWQAGHTGTGVTVAVVDSGIDTTHPDLSDAVVRATDLTGGPARPNPDDSGHGTHVASIITGSGVATDGSSKGVAPDTKLIDVKVLDAAGSATESTVVAGLDYAARSGAQVVNVSVGVDFQSEGDDPMSAAIDRLTAQFGALFVVAAGNSGPYTKTIGGPAAAAAALTVGAVDGDNNVASFSARGPRYHDGRLKPEITAPGTRIAAAYAGRGDTDGPYIVHRGTSMAAPHVAGAAAVLAAQHPDWTPAELKGALMGSATPNATAGPYEQGAGRVDLAKASLSPVQVLTPAVDRGVVAWPHTDDTPTATPVTYVNTGTTAVTLTLAADVRGPDGAAAPAGLVGVDRPQLTVPAGGRATAIVTTDTRTAPLGVWTGGLTATGPGVALRTPIAMDVEAERYDVAVTMKDRDGAPTHDYGFRLTNLDTREEWTPWDPDGAIRVRVPKGRYRFDAFQKAPGTPAQEPFRFDDYVLAVEPELTVDRNVSVDVDARTARPVALKVQRPDARQGLATLDFDTLKGTENVVSYSWMPPDTTFRHYRIRPSTTRSAQFRFTAEASLAKPAADGTYRNSPYLYKVRSVTDGVVPAGVDRTYADRDLAAVGTTLAATGTGRTGHRDIVTADLPATLTEYYTPGHAWYPDFTQWNGSHRDHLTSSLVRIYSRGQRTNATWNSAVFGPSLPPRPARTFHAERVGDQITFGIPMFGDGGVNNTGFSDSVIAEKTVLSAEDKVIGEYPSAGRGYFTVPAAAGRYRLHTEMAQNAASTSTSISADWQFASAPGTGNEVQVLPLLAVRFTPELDQWNRAPAGRFTFPVAVQKNGAGLVRAGVALTVEASFDDGGTWRPVPVTVVGNRWNVTVDAPAGTGFVALKATAKEADGNAVEQVIMRAYGVR